jgi:hypothetical protein
VGVALEFSEVDAGVVAGTIHARKPRFLLCHRARASSVTWTYFGHSGVAVTIASVGP